MLRTKSNRAANLVHLIEYAVAQDECVSTIRGVYSYKD